MGAAERSETHFGQSPMDDFSQPHEVLDRAGHVFNRDGGIDATLIEQVDTVSARALQHAIDRQFDVPRSAVEPGTALAGPQVDVLAELGFVTTVNQVSTATPPLEPLSVF